MNTPDIEGSGEKAVCDPSAVGAPTERLLKLEGSEDPKEWPKIRKWTVTILASTFSFFTLLVSTMVAPALPSISRDLQIRDDVQTQIILSVYVLSYAAGPFVFGPLSEHFGRVWVLQAANLCFLVFNTVCGFAQSQRLLIAARLFSGFGGSGALAVNPGLLSDCWRPEERGKSIGLYSLIPLFGPAIGPTIGGFIAQYSTWRWAFWSTSMFQGTMQLLALFLMPETYPPVLLARKSRRLLNDTSVSVPRKASQESHGILPSALRVHLVRPFRLLFTQPIIFILSLYFTYSYGLLWLVHSSFYALWTNRYSEPVSISGVNYISLGLGFSIGARIAAVVNDRLYAHVKARKGESPEPEIRIPLMLPAALLSPIGLLIYGWTAEAHTHPLLPNLGACIFGIGQIIAGQCLTAYLIDIYPRYAASAVVAATTLRNFAGFAFPLFAPAMYRSLGYGWGNTTIAAIAVVIGLPAPILVWGLGTRLRARSTFAAGHEGQ